MKRVFFLLALILLLPTLESCGNDDNQEVYSSGEKSPSRVEKCESSTSLEDWKIFVDNVKKSAFADFSGWTSCQEIHRKIKLSNCGQKGIFYICEGSTYNKPDGSNACSSGDAHQQILNALVTPKPLNFQAVICEGVMVEAQIAVSGKGAQPDLYRFDFDYPVHYNPIFKQVWSDHDRRYRITVRQ